MMKKKKRKEVFNMVRRITIRKKIIRKMNREIFKNGFDNGAELLENISNELATGKYDDKIKPEDRKTKSFYLEKEKQEVISNKAKELGFNNMGELIEAVLDYKEDYEF